MSEHHKRNNKNKKYSQSRTDIARQSHKDDREPSCHRSRDHTMSALRRKFAHGSHDLYLAGKAITALSRVSHRSADILQRVDPRSLNVGGRKYPLSLLAMEERSTRARARVGVMLAEDVVDTGLTMIGLVSMWMVVGVDTGS